MGWNAQQLLERLSETDRNADQEVDITFTFSHDDFDYLFPLSEEIGDLFADKLNVDCDSVVIGYNERSSVKAADGAMEIRPPHFTLTYVGPLAADQLAMPHELATRFATQHQITYLGENGWCG